MLGYILGVDAIGQNQYNALYENEQASNSTLRIQKTFFGLMDMMM